MKYIGYYLSFMLLLISCKNNKEHSFSLPEVSSTEKNEISSVFWLVGEWVNQKDGQFSKETWVRLNDSTLSGFSYIQIEKDTVFAENLTLSQQGGALLLTVTAFNQNNDAPVTFTKISSKNKTFVFENKAHDFPQRIIYTQPSQNRIHAWIEGKVKDTMKKVDFYFTRSR